MTELKRFCRTSLFAVILASAAWCGGANSGALSVTGTIEGTNIRVGSRVGGRIADVAVKEGDLVTAGQVLLKLECSEQEAALAAAKAKLTQAQANLEKLETGARPEELAQAQAAAAATEAAYQMALNGARSQEIAAARAMANAAKAQLDTADQDFARVKKLREGNAVSEQMYDQALHRLEAAQNQFKASSEQLDMLAKGTRNEQIEMARAERDRAAAAYELLKNGARKEDIATAKAACDAAQAEVLRAETLLSEMTVKAPRDAVVESLDVHPGDLVQPGPVMQLLDPQDLKLIVYVSEIALGQLRLGEEVTFTTDSHGMETFKGKISYLAPAGEFTPRNLQTQEERVQQVFGVKVTFDSQGGKLKPGMAATVHLPITTAVK